MTMEFSDKVMDYDAIFKDYAEAADMMIVNFEQSCFDLRMEKLLQGMVESDWVKAMQNAHTLKGSSGYVKAFPFMQCVKKFQEYIKMDCERIEYQDYSTNEDRPQYKLLDSFTDEKRLVAFDYFHPIVEQALLLKKEMSKYSKSVVPNDLYQKEAQEIRKLHDDFKKKAGLNTTKGLQSMKSVVSKQQNYMTSSVVDVLDPPVQNNKCCDKCVIF